MILGFGKETLIMGSTFEVWKKGFESFFQINKLILILMNQNRKGKTMGHIHSI